MKDGAAYFCDPHRRLLVLIEEQFLHSDSVRLEFLDQAFTFARDSVEPLVERGIRRRLDAIGVEPCFFPAALLEEGDAAATVSGVYRKDAHMYKYQVSSIKYQTGSMIRSCFAYF